jgi:hypothetical protein
MNTGSQPRQRHNLKTLRVWRITPNMQHRCTLLRAIGTPGMSDFSRELTRLMQVRGVGVRELARAAYCNPGHISNLRSGKARPSPKLAADLDRQLAAGGALEELRVSAGGRTSAV